MKLLFRRLAEHLSHVGQQAHQGHVPLFPDHDGRKNQPAATPRAVRLEDKAFITRFVNIDFETDSAQGAILFC